MNADKTTKSFNFTKKEALALLAFAGKTSAKVPFLACIRFEPNETRSAEIVASDGVALVFVELKPKFERNSFSVSTEEFDRSVRSLSSKDVLNVSGGEGSSKQVFLTAGVSGCARRIFEPEGVYPKWRQVVPASFVSDKFPMDLGFDSKLLARLALVQAASGAKGGVFSYHQQEEALKAVFTGGDATWTVVVMGMKL